MAIRELYNRSRYHIDMVRIIKCEYLIGIKVGPDAKIVIKVVDQE